ncbi:MAG: PepSY domain-containing protein [Proteobacteria bacterium]|uniref:PepSY domain-containing protein n=1 Tax=Rudaea sp. TaxID=2136325 RepID=UPI001D6CC54F|nr:PepSY domain-containing protein [Pseudomonadota bacterium]MBS0568903.1 PepSY domain-containing protein [Pseudomonadota bacterium]
MLTINTKSTACAALASLAFVLGTAATAAPAGMLSLDDIESRASAQGIQVKDIEVRDRLVEVEGRDASAQKVKLVYDRKTGEVLSREVKVQKSKTR